MLFILRKSREPWPTADSTRLLLLSSCLGVFFQIARQNCTTCSENIRPPTCGFDIVLFVATPLDFLSGDSGKTNATVSSTEFYKSFFTFIFLRLFFSNSLAQAVENRVVKIVLFSQLA